VAERRLETVSQANATSTLEIPELPKGTRYMVVRKRITKRPKRKRRSERKIEATLTGIRSRA